MAIITKHKDTAGAAAGALETGELGVNTVDGTLSVGSATGNVDLVSPGATTLPTGTNFQTLRSAAGVWEATNSLLINASGEAGIGTIPITSRRLAVESSDVMQILANSTGAEAGISFATVGSTNTFGTRVGAKVDDLVFVTDGDERVRIDSTGNVGVGTDSPMFALHVIGTTRATTVLGSAGSAAAPSHSFAGTLDAGMYNPAADTVSFSADGTERMRINTSATFVEGGYSSLDRVAGTVSQSVDRIHRFYTCSQAEYDALTKDDNTLYIIV